MWRVRGAHAAWDLSVGPGRRLVAKSSEFSRSKSHAIVILHGARAWLSAVVRSGNPAVSEFWSFGVLEFGVTRYCTVHEPGSSAPSG